MLVLLHICTYNRPIFFRGQSPLRRPLPPNCMC